jgi:hypothetical protein
MTEKKRITKIVDFLWDHKIVVLLLVAGTFFAIRGTHEAVKSITTLEPHTIEATTHLP